MRRTPCWLLVVGLVAALPYEPCDAEESIIGPTHTIRMPQTGGRALGFTTQIEIARQSTAGYMPVKITVKAIGALPADRQLIYRFETPPGGQTPPRRGLVIDVPVTVAQGTRTISFIRYLPKWSAGEAIDVSVIEEGRVLPDYIGFGGTLTRRSRETREHLHAEYGVDWVYISFEENTPEKLHPDLAGLLDISVGDLDSLTEEERASVWASDGGLENVFAIGQSELPSDWRAYQRFDVAIVNTEGLLRLSTKESSMQALRGWILCGGRVVVYDADSPQSVLQLLNLRWTNDPDAGARIRKTAKALQSEMESYTSELEVEIANLKKYIDLATKNAAASDGRESAQAISSELEFLEMHRLFVGNVSEAKAQLAAQQQKLSRRTPEIDLSGANEPVWMQGAGAGAVFGMGKSSEFAVPPPEYWSLVVRMMGYHVSPTVRRGVDPMLGDRRFARWLIPGVAEPPVYTFMGLLTVFVVLVGPVAYRRTSKNGRSYLMFAIAPALALFTTVAMFGYGIVSDGFGTVIRARQLTWVDSESGDAAERIQATYFAGVRPSDGLRFQGNAEVMGYPEGTGKSWEEINELSPATLGTVRVEVDSQVFDSAFLPSRQQRQFVTHAPRYNVGFLELLPDPNAISAPNIKNGFDFRIREAVVRDGRGTYWVIENLEPGDTRLGTQLESKNASKALGRIYNTYRPLSRVRETSSNRPRYDNNVYDVVVDTNRLVDSTQQVTSGTFEHWLQQHLQTIGEIPRDHFVAVADVSADVLAVNDRELAASVRYVFGTLR